MLDFAPIAADTEISGLQCGQAFTTHVCRGFPWMRLCRLLRNGYDAHVIKAPVQEHLLKHSKQRAVDIACEPDLETLLKLFPEAHVEPDQRAIAQMEKDGVLFRFYAPEVEDASHPELSLLRITPTMANMMDPQERLQLRMTGFGSPAPTGDVYAPLLWPLMATLSMGGIAFLLSRRKHRKEP